MEISETNNGNIEETRTSTASKNHCRELGKEMCAAPLLTNVGVRFLPFNDISDFSGDCGSSNVAVDVAAAEGFAAKLGGGRAAMHFQRGGRSFEKNCCVRGNSDESSLVMLNNLNSVTASSFLDTLQFVLACTAVNDTNGTTVADVKKNDTTDGGLWLGIFKTWPLELAASGYAEWWLRHPRCCIDATSFFVSIIEGLAKEENRRRSFHLGDFGDKECFTGVILGTLVMLRSIYASPPQSLKNTFSSSLYHHRLFFILCRLGAYRCHGVCKAQGRTRELALCLSLAASVAQRIAGEKLIIRHLLICFLGNVQCEWSSLLEARSDKEMLQIEFNQVHSLLEFAID